MLLKGHVNKLQARPAPKSSARPSVHTRPQEAPLALETAAASPSQAVPPVKSVEPVSVSASPCTRCDALESQHQCESSVGPAASCAGCKLRALLTSPSTTLDELRAAVESEEAFVKEARRELGQKELRRRRAAHEELHVAMQKGNDEKQLEKAISEARKAGVDQEDVAKAETALADWRAAPEEERERRARHAEEMVSKRKAFQLVKRDSAEELANLLSGLHPDALWRKWKDHAGRTLIRSAQVSQSRKVEQRLYELLPPLSPAETRPHGRKQSEDPVQVPRFGDCRVRSENAAEHSAAAADSHGRSQYPPSALMVDETTQDRHVIDAAADAGLKEKALRADWYSSTEVPYSKLLEQRLHVLSPPLTSVGNRPCRKQSEAVQDQRDGDCRSKIEDAAEQSAAAADSHGQAQYLTSVDATTQDGEAILAADDTGLKEEALNVDCGTSAEAGMQTRAKIDMIPEPAPMDVSSMSWSSESQDGRVINAADEADLKKKAFRAVCQDDCETLTEVFGCISSDTWSTWANKAGKNLLDLSQERGSKAAYSLIAKSLGLIKEVKRELFEEREAVWIFSAGDVQPRQATVLEDTPLEADKILIEFWDGADEPIYIDRCQIHKSHS